MREAKRCDLHKLESLTGSSWARKYVWNSGISGHNSLDEFLAMSAVRIMSLRYAYMLTCCSQFKPWPHRLQSIPVESGLGVIDPVASSIAKGCNH